MLRNRPGRALLAAVALAGLSACTVPPMVQPQDAVEADDIDGDDWVVVVYAFGDEEPSAMLELLDTEMAADAALAEAGLGWIDGNEIGDESYDLYFAGSDAAAMWAVLRPVLDDGPVAWTSAELRDTLEDPDPTIVLND